MRRFIIAAVVLVAAQVAFAQGEAAPEAAPSPAAEEPSKAAAPEKTAEPAKTAEPEKATEPKHEDAAVQPASGTAGGLDVRPASATVKRKKTPPDAGSPDAAAAAAAMTGTLPAAPPPLSKEEEEKAKALANELRQRTNELSKQPGAIDDATPPSEKELVEASARNLFFAMTNGDARTITEEAVTPFVLEDKRIDSPDELFQQWLKHLRTKRTDLLVLYGVEVLTPDEMEKKYGKPPARLASLPWKSPRTYIAVGNLSGHAAIALFRETRPSEYYLVGYTD